MTQPYPLRRSAHRSYSSNAGKVSPLEGESISTCRKDPLQSNPRFRGKAEMRNLFEINKNTVKISYSGGPHTRCRLASPFPSTLLSGHLVPTQGKPAAQHMRNERVRSTIPRHEARIDYRQVGSFFRCPNFSMICRIPPISDDILDVFLPLLTGPNTRTRQLTASGGSRGQTKFWRRN